MTESTYVERLLEQLDAIDDKYRDVARRYRHFTHRATLALVILFGSNGWFLFVALPQKNDQIQQSRSTVVRRVCEDEKTLVSIVPPGYPPLVRALRAHPHSALNPARDCDQFVRRFVRP